MFNREISNKVKQYRKTLEEEERQYNRLVAKNMDYAFLEQLIKRCENNKDLVVEVRLNDGTQLTIKTDRVPLKLKSSELFEQIEV